MDYVKHLTYAQASNDETIDHLETLFETKSLQDEELFNSLLNKLEQLGKMLNKFTQSIRSRTQYPEPRA
jgi:four helix bundle protein